jgi:hypothetical protein
MTTYTANTPKITGTTPTYQAVSASDALPFRGERSFLVVKNGGGSPTNVTVVIPGTIYGQPIPDVTVAVPAAGERWIGPFKADMDDATTGNITVNYSLTTSVTAAYVVL